MLGEIACAKPIYADEDRESYIEVETDILVDFYLISKGDIIINTRIYDSDIVFIREEPLVDNREIVIVIINESAILKRVEYIPDKDILMLKAENPAYSILMYLKEELNQIIILGKAIAFQSYYINKILGGFIWDIF